MSGERQEMDTDTGVDEALYSRQLYVMGHEAQRRMACSDVLVIGFSGLGVEVSKNLVLAGVKSLTLLDPTPATWGDLASNFFIGEDGIVSTSSFAITLKECFSSIFLIQCDISTDIG
eukprot:369647_1